MTPFKHLLDDLAHYIGLVLLIILLAFMLTQGEILYLL